MTDTVEGRFCPLLSLATRAPVQCQGQTCAWYTGTCCVVAQKGGEDDDRA